MPNYNILLIESREDLSRDIHYVPGLGELAFLTCSFSLNQSIEWTQYHSKS